jgi:hypothetical protein
MSAGYLAVSHPDWCEHIQATRPRRCAFCRRDTRRFRNLSSGARFFFSRKQGSSDLLDRRCVIGSAEFQTFEVQPLNELPATFGFNKLGPWWDPARN